MQKLTVFCAVGLLTMAPALASDKTDVMAIVKKWGSTGPESAASNCAAEASVIDSIPPHEWHGAGACANWLKDYGAFAKQNNMTGAHAVVGKARHIEVTADHAYVVVPVTYYYKLGGKDTQEAATATFALQKGADGWRITGWAYSER